MPTVIFRADASAASGAGHVMRCLALAEAFGAAGWECLLATGPQTAAALPDTARLLPQLPVKSNASSAEQAAALARDCDLLVVDGYGLDHDFESACRGWAKRIWVLDDLADRRHDCDLLIDGNPWRRAADYRDHVSAETALRLGPDTAPLRPAWAQARRRQQEPGHTLLVSMGATDPANMTARALTMIAAAALAAPVRVVLPRQAPHHAAARRQVAECSGDIALLDHDVDMVAETATARLCLGAGGGSMWERCCLGIPTLLMQAADNQSLNADALVAAGAGEVADGQLAALWHDDARLAAMSAAAARLCDGLGAWRLAAEATQAAMAADGAPVRLRRATEADRDRVLDWQREPGARQHARVAEVPSAQEHAAWFAAKLDDRLAVFSIILHGEAPAGFVRLDRHGKDDGYEVSILVAQAKQRLGLARIALDLAQVLAGGEAVWAEVLPGNEASRALFLGAGYRPAAPAGWYLRDSLKSGKETA